MRALFLKAQFLFAFSTADPPVWVRKNNLFFCLKGLDFLKKALSANSLSLFFTLRGFDSDFLEYFLHFVVIP